MLLLHVGLKEELLPSNLYIYVYIYIYFFFSVNTFVIA